MILPIIKSGLKSDKDRIIKFLIGLLVKYENYQYFKLTPIRKQMEMMKYNRKTVFISQNLSQSLETKGNFNENDKKRVFVWTIVMENAKDKRK